MFATDNDYEEAIRGSSLHAFEEREHKKRVLVKLLSFTTGAVLLYVGFNYYQEDSLQEIQNLKVSSEPLAKNKFDNSKLTQKVLEMGKDELVQSEAHKDKYLIALENMEVDVLDDSQPSKSISTPSISKGTTTDSNQVDLTKAISNIVDESVADNSSYTNELKKEIIAKNSSKSRVIIVKKGDTLESISKKFYGNSMKYKEIMASNSNLLNDSGNIYEGEKIILPY